MTPESSRRKTARANARARGKAKALKAKASVTKAKYKRRSTAPQNERPKKNERKDGSKMTNFKGNKTIRNSRLQPAHVNAKGKTTRVSIPARKELSPDSNMPCRIEIVTATVADIRRARAGNGPSESHRKAQQDRKLVRIRSKVERSRLYEEAAQSIAAREVASLPVFGGRQWSCEVRVSDGGGAFGSGGGPNEDRESDVELVTGGPWWAHGENGKSAVSKKNVNLTGKGGALFRWYRGNLELACLPHILAQAERKVENPDSQRTCGGVEGNSSEKPEAEHLPKTALQERQISELSQIALVHTEHPAPNVERCWLSPNGQWFHSRKSVVDHVSELIKQDKLINRVLHGIGEGGSLLRPAKPTKKMALEAGHCRFLRDGLWVVGQEEEWLETRAEIWRKPKQKKTEKQKDLTKEMEKKITLMENSDKVKLPIVSPSPGYEQKPSGFQHKKPMISTKGKVGTEDLNPTAQKTPPVPLVKPCRTRSIASSNHWRLKPNQVDLCYDAVMDHYNGVMYTVKARNLYFELADGFDVLRERGGGRFDMELDKFDSDKFGFLTNPSKASWMPVVHKILGDDAVLVHKGAFLSLPGSEIQIYHQDGVHLTRKKQLPCHAINVFIPLVDLTGKNGPTEFCLGTHVLGHEGYVKERIETPHVTAGTPVIFDYRLGHRGMGNTSQEPRPIVYLTYTSASNEFRDSVNFSRRRYKKLGDIIERPPSREERLKKRKKPGE